MKYKSILMTLLLTFFIGCGGGSSSSSSTDYSTNPSVKLTNTQGTKDANGNLTDLTTNITFTEQNSNLHNAVFSLLDVSSSECQVTSFNLVPQALNDNQTGTLTLKLSGCQDIKTLNFNIAEKVNYTDTIEKSKLEKKLLSTNVTKIAYNGTDTTTGTTTTTSSSTVQDNTPSHYATKLIILPNKLNITTPSQREKIKIITVDENNRPIPAKVTMNKLIDENDKEYGTLDTYEIMTNSQGEAFVTYTAPKNIDNISEDKQIAFEIANTSLDRNITLTFNKEDKPTKKQKLILLPNYEHITEPNQQETIRIISVDENNRPLSTKVLINALIDDKNESDIFSYGSLDKYEVITNNEGEAFVTYTAPKDMSKVDNKEQNITFEIADTSIDKNVRLEFNNTGTNDGNPHIIILPNNVIITESNQIQKFDIVTIDENNRPLSTKVLINRLIDKNDIEYGTLDTYEVITNEKGEATVTYTAPKNINSVFADTNDTNDTNNSITKSITFEIFNTTIKGNADLIFPKQKNDNPKYNIQLVMKNSIPVDSSSSFTVKIFKIADNSVINKEYVKDVNVSIEGKHIYFDNNESNTSMDYNQSSAKSIDIHTNKYACIEFVDVNVSVNDGEKEENISKRFKVVITSGPIDAISINHLNTIYNGNNGLYVEKYAIHAVDKYSNPANAGSKIYFGAINGHKVYREYNGSIGLNGDNTEFNVSNTNLNDYDVDEEDVVSILASSDKMNSRYLGGWIIKDLVDNDTVNFSSKYDGESTDKLKFVIGNEKRYDKCSDSLSLVDIDSTDGTYEVDSNGIAYATLKYDPYVVGKTIILYANSISENRVGTSKKIILYGTGIITPSIRACPKDQNCSMKLKFVLKDSGAPLQNTVLQKDLFMQTDSYGWDTSECNITIENNRTDCKGILDVNLTHNKGKDSCQIKWSEMIDYEYFQKN